MRPTRRRSSRSRGSRSTAACRSRDLRGTLEHLARNLFGADREIRLRSHFFPFTEPSVELDVTCFACDGPGGTCRVCKGEGWIEIGGAGMVDPNVFGFVEATTPRSSQGSRSAAASSASRCSRYGIDHVAKFYDNDLRFLEQFAGAVR